MPATPPTRPQPVVDAQKVTAAVLGVFGAAVTLLAAFGVIVTNDTQQAVTAVLTGIGTLAGIVLPIVLAKRSAEKVTPIVDPQDNWGQPLVPSTVDLSGPIPDDQPGT